MSARFILRVSLATAILVSVASSRLHAQGGDQTIKPVGTMEKVPDLDPVGDIDPLKKPPAAPPGRPHSTAPDFFVAIWYDKSDPCGSFKTQVYDNRKPNDHKQALDAWVRRFELFPQSAAYVKDVYLADWNGTTDREKLDRFVNEERKDVCKPVTAFPSLGGTTWTGSEVEVYDTTRNGGTVRRNTVGITLTFNANGTLTKMTRREAGKTRVDADYRWQQSGNNVSLYCLIKSQVPVGYSTTESKYNLALNGKNMKGRGIMIARTYGSALGRLSGAPSQDYSFLVDVSQQDQPSR